MSNDTIHETRPTQSPIKHIWVITGPAGCGKTTVGRHLAASLSLPYIEGDEFHPPANVEKMASGHALTDGDRWDWLILLRQEAMSKLSGDTLGVVLTCSALKHKYRDVMRIAPYNDSNVLVHFVYLRANEELLLARVQARQGHYMKADMVVSQFDSLEEPTTEERDCLTLDVSGTTLQVQDAAVELLKHVLEKKVDEVHAHSMS